jgi:hypothetical protein
VCLATGGSKATVDLVSPVVAAKAIKNEAELEGMRQAHLRDAVAICDFLNWLENKVWLPCKSSQARAAAAAAPQRHPRPISLSLHLMLVRPPAAAAAVCVLSCWAELSAARIRRQSH